MTVLGLHSGHRCTSGPPGRRNYPRPHAQLVPAADLFAAAAEDRLTRQAPLAARLRPATLDDVVGQEHLLGPGRPLRTLIEADRLSSVILWGPPGTGKTTLAQLIAHTTAKAYVQLSAVTATVKDVREVIARAPATASASAARARSCSSTRSTGSTRPSRTPCCPSVESGLLVLIGATTENPYFEVNPPLLSPLDAVPPRAARRPTRCATLLEPRPRGRGRHRRATRRSTTWPTGPPATAATR